MTDSAPTAVDVDVPAMVMDSAAASAPALALLEFPVTLLDTPAELEAPTAVALCTPETALPIDGATGPVDVVAWFALRAAEYESGSVKVPTDVAADVPATAIDNDTDVLPVAAVDAVPDSDAIAPIDGESVPTEAVDGLPVRAFDNPTNSTPDAVETWLPVAARSTAGDRDPTTATVDVSERVAVAPTDGEIVPTPEVTDVLDSAVDKLGDTDPELAVPAPPVRDAEASPPPVSGTQTNDSSG